MRIELYHDILARKVYEQASAEEKMRLKVERQIKERYAYYLETERRIRLNKYDLEHITPYLEQVDITEGQRKFVEISQKAVSQAVRRRRVFITGVMLILILSGVAIWQWVKAMNAIEARKKARVEMLLQDVRVYKEAEEFHFEEMTLKEILKEDPNNKNARQMLNSLQTRAKENIK